MKNTLVLLTMLLLIGSTIAVTIWSLSFKDDLTGIISAENSASRRTNKNCFLWGNKGKWVGDWSDSQQLTVTQKEIRDKTTGDVFAIVEPGTYYTIGWICTPYNMPVESTAEVMDMRINFRADKTISNGYEFWAANPTDNLLVTRLTQNSYQVSSNGAIISTSVYSTSVDTGTKYKTGLTNWKFTVDITA